MDAAMRIMHIFFGVFWVGASILFLFFIEPRLRTLGHDIESRFMRALIPLISPVFGLSSFIIVGTGIVMVLRMRGGDLGMILATGWGIAILVGFIATVVAIIVGFGFSMPKGFRLKKLESNMEGRNPNENEQREIEEIFTRIRLVERVNIVLILVALFSMTVSRFV